MSSGGEDLVAANLSVQVVTNKTNVVFERRVPCDEQH
jgi:hypothetical protein